MSVQVSIKVFGKPAYIIHGPTPDIPVVSRADAEKIAENYLAGMSEPAEAVFTNVPDYKKEGKI